MAKDSSKSSNTPNPSNSNNPRLSRDQALDAKPVAAGILSHVKISLMAACTSTVPFYATSMQRWLLRVPASATRQFELDSMGAEVLNMCDGQRSVRDMTQQFARKHQVGVNEAENAVVTFLRTMVRRGLIVMLVEK